MAKIYCRCSNIDQKESRIVTHNKILCFYRDILNFCILLFIYIRTLNPLFYWRVQHPLPQLVEHVVGEVGSIHHQDIAEQAPEVLLGFPLRCSFTNLAATAFAILNHGHRQCKKSTIKYQKSKNMGAKWTAEV